MANLEAVKRFLEGDSDKHTPLIETLPDRFFDPFIMQGVQIDLIEPGRVLCSMKVPPRLLNSGGFLHGGATASLVDLIGSAAVYTTGAPKSGASLEISVSYVDAAFCDEEIEIDAKVLRVGKTVGVISVELRKKKTGKIFAQGRHTKFLPIIAKL